MNKPKYKTPYEVKDNGLLKWVSSVNSCKDILLCNFLPYLISEKVYDDGKEQRRYFEVGAIFEDGSLLPPITLTVADFKAMNWITSNWGAKCNVEAGRAVKEHIRHAIQSTGLELQPQIIYSHKPPRGVGMITAEYSPNISESGIARSIPLNIMPTDIDMDKLTQWQQKAEMEYLSSSMKSFIIWLESKLDSLEKQENFISKSKLYLNSIVKWLEICLNKKI